MKKNVEKKTETVFIPKLVRNDDALFVAVNGKRILVRKGENVELPEAFCEVIRNSEAARAEAQSYIEDASCVN